MKNLNPRPKAYKTWVTDSSRWEHYRPRDSDIVIATYAKCGTTWMQRIISLLIFQSPDPLPIHSMSPWIDCRFQLPLEEVKQVIENQDHRRFLKSHLPFDGLPHYDDVRYIHVARDGRDVCMSFFNHCEAFTPLAYEMMDATSQDMGKPYPHCPDDPRVFWQNWLTHGVQSGETDGYPDLSFFDFETTYWKARKTENLLLVHYNDLKADLDGEMRRIAKFLSIEPSPEIWRSLVESATFDGMRKDGAALLPGIEYAFEGGSDRFLYKGTNGRWRDLMTEDDLALYDKAAARFAPGLARWIEEGRLATGDPYVSED